MNRNGLAAARRCLCWLTLGFALVWVARPLPAASLAGPRFNRRIWQTDDGLPHNSVFAIAQAGDGYLWVGTQEGLARFDGVRFSPVEDETLRHGKIMALCAARDGSLWVACDGVGAAQWKDNQIVWLAETNGLPSNLTRCLLETKDGAIWIGSEGGLSRFQDGKLITYTDKNGLGDNSVRAVCEDSAGNLRIATRRGLSSLKRDGGLSTLNLALGMVGNVLKCVEEDNQGRIWTGSNEGLTCLAGETRTTYGVVEGLPNHIITALYKDRRGELWVGTFSGLAHIAEDLGFTRPISDDEPGERVYAIYQDREDNLWVGTWDGLCRLTPARFATYSTARGLNCNNVMSVRESRDGAMLFGTWGGGLNELRGSSIACYGTTNGLTHDSVLSLLEARDGGLWIGMDFDGGLNRVQAERRNVLPKQPGLGDSPVRVIHEDRNGVIWFGTGRGVKALSAGRLKTYGTANGLAGNLVMAICETRDGEIWFGTDGGLSRWRGNSFSNLTTRDGLSHNGVNALYEDREGALWIGTKAGGLNRFQAGRFKVYSTREGLFSDEVYEVLEDDFGFLWMSCRKGIFRVSRQEMDAFDRGEAPALNCIAYGRADGLVSVQCNGVAKPAGWKARDGRLWFPTICGAVAVDARLKTNLRPPPVVIETVQAEQKIYRVPPAAAASLPAVTIPPGRGQIEIRFTALSFQAPEKNRFKYQLSSVDRDWVEGDTSREVRYNNVAPGRHRFRVIACNNDGVWNREGAVVVLLLQPHVWQTWWFKLAVVLAAGLLFAAFYRARVRRLREIENLRVQIAADLHDDVGSRLTKVAMVTEHVDAETPVSDRNKPLIRNIASTTREIIQAMDEIVWTINPKNDTLENLANYIFQYAQDFFQDSGVRCRLDVPTRLPELKLSTQERHNLFMAVKEALNNVLKHAQATEVRVGLLSAGEKVIITIADNGRGFVTDIRPAAGNGLTNMRARLERIGGRLHLESRPGLGTEIKMEAEGE